MRNGLTTTTLVQEDPILHGLDNDQKRRVLSRANDLQGVASSPEATLTELIDAALALGISTLDSGAAFDLASLVSGSYARRGVEVTA